MEKQRRQTALIVQAARLYYQHAYSQQQIAGKLGISRPGVSRLLQQARDRGIVRIEIIDPADHGSALEEALKNKFSLRRAIVVPNDNNSSTVIKQRLGQACNALLNELLQPGMILGISWGTTMLQVARHVQPRPLRDSIVVQLNGGVSRAQYNTHASEVAQRLGELFGGIPYLLPLPAIVDNAGMKEAILNDKNIRRTFELARQASIAVFTIGSFGYDSLLVRSDYFDKSEVDALLQQGAVADICSRIIDHDGRICSPELDARTIGIQLAELRDKEYAIAVAGGREKLAAIRAALNGHYCNVLVTDEWVAERLLNDKESKQT